MPLERQTVDRTVGEHICHLRQTGAKLSDKDKRSIRKLHERIAEKVARRAAGRR